MKRISLFVFILAASSCAFAQAGGDVIYQRTGTAVSVGAFQRGPIAPVVGAPYSAAITNEMTQTLQDGNHIVQTMNGNVARDSQGRTRQDAPLPAIGNLAAANAPHLVFIQDPVAQTSYTLDLTDKTAQKMPTPPMPPPPGAMTSGGSMSSGSMSSGSMSSGAVSGEIMSGGAGSAAPGPVFVMRMDNSVPTAGAGPLPPPMPPPGPGVIAMQKMVFSDDSAQATTEDLGSQTMEGVLVNGTRVTRTIPAGQIGNDAPISIVTEVWTSPDLKTVVYSKRSDPRMGVQTFQLKNIVRAEPDPSLFTVPPDFRIVDGPQPVIYRTQ